MVRLGVLVLHIVLAAQAAVGGALFLLQGALNRTWELGFYGEVSPLTDGVVVGATFILSFCALHVTAAGAWAVGSRQGGQVLLVLTALLIALYPTMVAVLLGMSGLVVALDLLVAGHRASPSG